MRVTFLNDAWIQLIMTTVRKDVGTKWTIDSRMWAQPAMRRGKKYGHCLVCTFSMLNIVWLLMWRDSATRVLWRLSSSGSSLYKITDGGCGYYDDTPDIISMLLYAHPQHALLHIDELLLMIVQPVNLAEFHSLWVCNCKELFSLLIRRLFTYCFVQATVSIVQNVKVVH